MSANLKERYLVDEQGNRVAVVLDLEQYNHILAELDELADVRAFDAAKASDETPIPLVQALSEIERKRKGK